MTFNNYMSPSLSDRNWKSTTVNFVPWYNCRGYYSKNTPPVIEPFHEGDNKVQNKSSNLEKPFADGKASSSFHFLVKESDKNQHSILRSPFEVPF